MASYRETPGSWPLTPVLITSPSLVQDFSYSPRREFIQNFLWPPKRMEFSLKCEENGLADPLLAERLAGTKVLSTDYRQKHKLCWRKAIKCETRFLILAKQSPGNLISLLLPPVPVSFWRTSTGAVGSQICPRGTS